MLNARLSILRGMVATCALWLLCSTAASAASFQVSPTRFDFSLERRFTDFFLVTNNSGSQLRLRIATAFINLDAAGTAVESKDSPYDVAPWMVINPRRITLGPGEKRVVRFTVRPPTGLKEGEYRTVVFFEEQPSRPEEGKAADTAFQIRLLTRLGITIYGRIGNPTADMKLDKLSVTVGADRLDVHAAVQNAGTARVMADVTATVLDADGAEQGSAGERITVQREQMRPIALKIAAPEPGNYRLKVIAQMEDKTMLEAELPFSVPSSAQ